MREESSIVTERQLPLTWQSIRTGKEAGVRKRFWPRKQTRHLPAAFKLEDGSMSGNRSKWSTSLTDYFKEVSAADPQGRIDHGWLQETLSDLPSQHSEPFSCDEMLECLHRFACGKTCASDGVVASMLHSLPTSVCSRRAHHTIQ